MKVKQTIQCPYCDRKALPLTGHLAKPINPANTRYGCDNAHYFAVPTKDVLIKEYA